MFILNLPVEVCSKLFHWTICCVATIAAC